MCSPAHSPAAPLLGWLNTIDACMGVPRLCCTCVPHPLITCDTLTICFILRHLVPCPVLRSIFAPKPYVCALTFLACTLIPVAFPCPIPSPPLLSPAQPTCPLALQNETLAVATSHGVILGEEARMLLAMHNSSKNAGRVCGTLIGPIVVCDVLKCSLRFL